MKMRAKIDDHDYETKKGHVERFLKQGHKVKVTIMFRGREMAHTELGRRLLERLATDIVDIAQVDSPARQDGRNMIAVFSPRKNAAPPLGCAAFLRGEKTAIMLRPSCRAGLSTWAMSTMSVASRSSRRRPSSVCAISRPRNMIVTLTLWPCLRNRSTWPFFVS